MKSEWGSSFFHPQSSQAPTVGYPPMVPPPAHTSSSFFSGPQQSHQVQPQMNLHQSIPVVHQTQSVKAEPVSRSEQESSSNGSQIKVAELAFLKKFSNKSKINFKKNRLINQYFQGERCVGCGSEAAIRVHYGASSCHGCKAFFRRSVFEGRVYMCSADNQCDITNESRNRCRACRLRNCLDGGMNPKHVREERSKIERMPGNTCTVSATSGVTHNQPTTSASHNNTNNFNSSPPASVAASTSSNGFCPAKVESTTSSGSEAEVLDRKSLQEHHLTLFMVALEKQTEQLTDDDVKDNDYMGAWSRDISLTFGLQHPQMVIKRLPVRISRIQIRCEPTIFQLMYTCDRIMEASDLYLSWYRSFVFCADWAMGIPEFRVLPLADQTTLFKQNFMAFGWITFAYKCFQLKQHTIGIPLGNGAYIPYNDEEQKRLPERWALTYGVVCKKLVDLIVKVMIELNISEEEYCLIKTVSLFQQGKRSKPLVQVCISSVSDCILSEPGASICSKMRDRLLDALSTHIEKRFPYHTQSQRLTRALKISLMLPSFSVSQN